YSHRKRDRLSLWKAWRTYHGLTGNRKQEMRFIDLVTEQAEQQLEQSQQLQQENIDALNSYRLASVRQRLEVNDRLIRQKAAEVQVLEERATLRNTWIIFLVVISLITLITLTRYFLKRNKYQRMREQVLALQIRNRQLENEQLRKEAVEQKQELADVGAQNAQQRAQAENVLQQLKALKGATPNEQESAIHGLITAIRAQQEVASDNATLQEGVDSVHQEFYTRLEERFPTLTKSEKELCGLIRLELSGKEIANLRHVDPRSVTKSKNRLRKKLGLAPYEDLYQFLKAF
ncbi:MAG: hypothetical protein AAGB22_16050, partial [Bacteroidota bacterium]